MAPSCDDAPNVEWSPLGRVMRAAGIGIVAAVMGILLGCGNPCEAVCGEMAAFARECGYSVSQAEVDRCVLDQADVVAKSDDPGNTRKTCREYGDRVLIEQSWDCLEIGRYFPEQSVGENRR